MIWQRKLKHKTIHNYGNLFYMATPPLAIRGRWVGKRSYQQLSVSGNEDKVLKMLLNTISHA